MRDTVELLEAIGRDAQWRHASPADLAKALETAGASQGVREFAANGNAAVLIEELGIVELVGEHASHISGHDGDGGDDHSHHHDHDHDHGKPGKDHDGEDNTSKSGPDKSIDSPAD
ncbi:MAG: hypothetical protein WBW32_17215 [Luteibacter sp.]